MRGHYCVLRIDLLRLPERSDALRFSCLSVYLSDVNPGKLRFLSGRHKVAFPYPEGLRMHTLDTDIVYQVNVKARVSDDSQRGYHPWCSALEGKESEMLRSLPIYSQVPEL